MSSHNTALKIVFITQDYPPAPGGVATSAQRVARNLTRIGQKVLLLTLDGSRPISDANYVLTERDEAVEVRRIGPFFHRQPELISMQEDSRALVRRRAFDLMESVARPFQADLVLSFSAENAGLFGTFLSRSLEVPHVVGIRGADVGQYMFSLKHLSGLHMITTSATRIVCVNEHLRRRLLLGFPGLADRTSVIQNSVELPGSVPARRSRAYLSADVKWPSTAVVVAFIGAPREKKGIDILLHALQSAREKADLRFLIVGPDFRKEERQRCGDVIERLRADHAIHITGNLDRDRALEIAAEGDIIAMPSLDDGLPNGLLEGMAIGLCPIVSDLFQDLVIGGSSGWVVERYNPAELARALVDAAQSAGKRERFGAAAKAFITAHHDPAIEAKAYVRLFEEMLAKDALV